MSTYVIGDIQGCMASLRALLTRVGFRSGRDRLWLVGDLVNRGPASLETLRWAVQHQHELTMVLGNHDLHLLARAMGVRGPRRRDTLEAILAAPDRENLLDWLRRRPLLHHQDGRLLVHAGLLPNWSVDDALAIAAELEAELQGPGAAELLASYEDCADTRWEEVSDPARRRVVALTALTRLRGLRSDGLPCLASSGPPEQLPEGCLPWFRQPQAAWAGAQLLFGHWASLGLHREGTVQALDSGCVWGGQLSALRLDDGQLFSEPARERLGSEV